MAIREHPTPGTILLCNFENGFKVPEMVKRRPSVVVSPKIGGRPNLCTVVPLSTTPPKPKMAYHLLLHIDPPLPPPWHEGPNWAKADMIISVAFHRLDLIRLGKAMTGKRNYRYETLSSDQMKQLRRCMLYSLGMGRLTQHL